MKYILRLLWANWKPIRHFMLVSAFISFVLFAIVQEANQPKKYILAHGRYHSDTAFDCDFGYITDWAGVAKLDIDDNKIPCTNVKLPPHEMRRLSGNGNN